MGLIDRLASETHVETLEGVANLLADLGSSIIQPVVKKLGANIADEHAEALLKAIGWKWRSLHVLEVFPLRHGRISAVSGEPGRGPSRSGVSGVPTLAVRPKSQGTQRTTARRVRSRRHRSHRRSPRRLRSYPLPQQCLSFGSLRGADGRTGMQHRRKISRKQLKILDFETMKNIYRFSR